MRALVSRLRRASFLSEIMMLSAAHTQHRDEHAAVLCYCQNFKSGKNNGIYFYPLTLIDEESEAQSSQAVSTGVAQFKRSSSASL